MNALISLLHLCCLGGAPSKRDGGEQREGASGQCSGELGGCGDLDGDHRVGHVVHGGRGGHGGKVRCLLPIFWRT